MDGGFLIPPGLSPFLRRGRRSARGSNSGPGAELRFLCGRNRRRKGWPPLLAPLSFSILDVRALQVQPGGIQVLPVASVRKKFPAVPSIS